MKVLVADGRGAAGAGAITVQGAAVGDVIMGVLAQLPSGRLEYTDAGWFEPVVSVAGQVQQLLPLVHRLVPAVPFVGPEVFYGVDGVACAPHGLGTRVQLSQDPGHWRFVFLVQPAAAYSANGAIGITEGIATITKTSAAALTLAAPLSGTDDGKELLIISETAFAHTVTQTTPGFNNGGAASDVATFGAAIGNNLNLIARGGKWYVVSQVGVTLA